MNGPLRAISVAALVSLAWVAAAPGAKICIDPGHGGTDPGAVGNGLREADINLAVSLRTRDIFNADSSSGWTVIITRTTDVFVSLQGRCDYANNNGADRFISCHCNSFTDPSAHGTETYCSTSYSGPNDYDLRNKINPEMVEHMATTNRGVKTADFWVLNNTHMSAALCEKAFISNAADAAKLGASSYQQEAARAYLHGLQAHYGIPVHDPGPGPSVDDAQLVSDSIPGQLFTGQTVQASVTFRNSGTSTWTRTDGFKLGAAGDSDPFAATRQQLNSGETVPPGGQRTFSFDFTAPGSAGTYTTDWRMVHENVRWFGDTLTRQVSVNNQPNTSSVVIIESRPGGQNQGWYSEQGGWADSSGSSAAEGCTANLGSRYASTYRSVAGVKAAVFTPVFNDSALWRVYCTWPNGANRRGPILYRVSHAGGATDVNVDQAQTANIWVDLGAFYFNAGSGGSVRMSNDNVDASGSMYASASRFVRENGSITPPSLTTQPENQRVCAGSTARFTISANGTAPLAYQWQRNQSDLPNDGHFANVNSPTLTVTDVQPGDAGTYRCRVANGGGSVLSNGAGLTIDVSPTITAQPQSQHVCAGGSTTFTAQADGTGPLTFQWRKDGGDLAGAVGTSLFIPAVSQAHAGIYDVVVRNGCGTAVSGSARLEIDAGPSIAVHPSAQSACSGGSATFSVQAGGQGPFTYQWRRNGADLSGATGSTLTLAPASVSDAGLYDVVVRNACGMAVSEAAALTVTAGPAVTVQPVDQAGCAGGSMSLIVVANGAAPLGYQWQKDGTAIPGETRLYLYLSDVRPADSGLYDVAVRNVCGEVFSRAAQLTIYPHGTGDANGDGRLDGLDVAVFAETIAAQTTGPMDEKFCVCDLDGNSVLTGSDAEQFVLRLLGR